jgi:hypothetical protein
MRTQKKLQLFSLLGICLGVSLWFGYLGRAARASQQPDRPTRAVLSKVPQIKNCIEHIKLVKAQLLNQGEHQVASLELENDAYIGVTAISVETLGGKQKYTVIESGYSTDKEPLIIIPARGKKTVTIGNLFENCRLRIASVRFSDGTEEGCEMALQTMRKMKDHDTKKGEP